MERLGPRQRAAAQARAGCDLEVGQARLPPLAAARQRARAGFQPPAPANAPAAEVEGSTGSGASTAPPAPPAPGSRAPQSPGPTPSRAPQSTASIQATYLSLRPSRWAWQGWAGPASLHRATPSVHVARPFPPICSWVRGVCQPGQQRRSFLHQPGQPLPNDPSPSPSSSFTPNFCQPRDGFVAADKT